MVRGDKEKEPSDTESCQPPRVDDETVGEMGRRVKHVLHIWGRRGHGRVLQSYGRTGLPFQKRWQNLRHRVGMENAHAILKPKVWCCAGGRAENVSEKQLEGYHVTNR